MKLFGFDTDESVDQIIAGSSDLPDTAKGSKQKPLPAGMGYDWKPSEAETQRDIAQAETRDRIIREATRREQQLTEVKQTVTSPEPFTATSTAAEDRKAMLEQAKGLFSKLGKLTRDEATAILQNYEELKRELSWTPLPSGEQVWEEGKKNGKAINEDLKKKSAEMALDIMQTTPAGAIAGLIKGQSIFRGTKVAQVDPQIISRRLEQPGSEFGMHVSIDPKTAELMQYDYNTGKVGSTIELKSSVDKPLRLPDTGGSWPPERVYDYIEKAASSKDIKFSEAGLNKLKSLKNELETKKLEFFEKNVTYTTEQYAKYSDELESQFAKKMQKAIKDEGYDHISYTNIREGEPVESAIIFDKSDIKLK